MYSAPYISSANISHCAYSSVSASSVPSFSRFSSCSLATFVQTSGAHISVSISSLRASSSAIRSSHFLRSFSRLRFAAESSLWAFQSSFVSDAVFAVLSLFAFPVTGDRLRGVLLDVLPSAFWAAIRASCSSLFSR